MIYDLLPKTLSHCWISLFSLINNFICYHLWTLLQSCLYCSNCWQLWPFKNTYMQCIELLFSPIFQWLFPEPPSSHPCCCFLHIWNREILFLLYEYVTQKSKIQSRALDPLALMQITFSDGPIYDSPLKFSDIFTFTVNVMTWLFSLRSQNPVCGERDQSDTNCSHENYYVHTI